MFVDCSCEDSLTASLSSSKCSSALSFDELQNNDVHYNSFSNAKKCTKFVSFNADVEVFLIPLRTELSIYKDELWYPRRKSKSSKCKQSILRKQRVRFYSFVDIIPIPSRADMSASLKDLYYSSHDINTFELETLIEKEIDWFGSNKNETQRQQYFNHKSVAPKITIVERSFNQDQDDDNRSSCIIS